MRDKVLLIAAVS